MTPMPPLPQISEEAATLHREALVIDSHNDSIVYHIRMGNRSMSGAPDDTLARRDGTIRYLRGPLDSAARCQEPQIDFPKMRAGGIDAAFFAVDVTRAWRNHLAYALDGHGFFAADLAAHPNEATLALDAAGIRAARAAGKLAAVLTIENSEALDGSINVLRMFHRIGVRAISLTHNPRSLAADGVGETRTGGGLTEFGVQLVREMNDLGILVDISHLSERGFWDVMEATTKPVIASHSSCRQLCEHPRNLNDSQLRAMKENGGVVGITFVPDFIDPDHPTLERLLDHFEHALAVAGPGHVGIGSDFDGGGTLLRDATEYPLITQGLLDRGHSPDEIRLVLGENLLRVLG
ncbi:MAG: membrane dipeptidase [Chloroflexi bacterium]|nr:membrane dipeptidase [Chloroflexota bacterium]